MSNLDALEELARLSSSEARRDLLRGLTDLFLENMDEHNEAKGDVFGDIVNKVLDDVVEEARIEFSQRISTVENFPNEVVTKLAWDSFDVAGPVLANSNALTDEDLVAVASEKSDEYLLAISQRSEVNPSVTDVLIERGSDNVVHAIADNPGAHFSTGGYGALVEKAQDDKKLQEKIVRREDITPDVAEELEPFLNAQLRKRLTSKMAKVEGEIDGLVSKAKKRVETALTGKKKDRADAETLIQQVKDGEIDLDEAVIQLAVATRPKPLSAMLAGIADLPESIIANTMLKINGTPIAISCKALRVSSLAFVEVSKMRSKVLKLPSSTSDRLSEQYLTLSEDDADRAMRFLRIRYSLSGKVDSEQAA